MILKLSYAFLISSILLSVSNFISNSPFDTFSIAFFKMGIGFKIIFIVIAINGALIKSVTIVTQILVEKSPNHSKNLSPIETTTTATTKDPTRIPRTNKIK